MDRAGDNTLERGANCAPAEGITISGERTEGASGEPRVRSHSVPDGFPDGLGRKGRTVGENLLKTPLHALHLELGGKMVPFAGYEMPVQYKLGVMKEHLWTREHTGLFDVSHMGQVILRAKSGNVQDAAAALEQLVPVNIVGLKTGRQRYALFHKMRCVAESLL